MKTALMGFHTDSVANIFSAGSRVLQMNQSANWTISYGFVDEHCIGTNIRGLNHEFK